MTRPLIAANWKMHKTISEAVAFSKQLKKDFTESCEVDIVIAPPFTALFSVAEILKDSAIHISAQNMHWEDKGSYTGEISAVMLVDAGCEFVIIGHSERRTLFGENDSMLNRKIRAALRSGLKPIFCIGETLDERESGTTFEVIKKQLKEGLNNITSSDIGEIVFAYEPVWAIGTGKTATPFQAQEAHSFIRETIARDLAYGRASETVIIYGGSVNPENAGSLMDQPDINGALVGGAGLDSGSFADIIRTSGR